MKLSQTKGIEKKEEVDESGDAWSMGKNIINLGNLKQSMSLEVKDFLVDNDKSHESVLYIASPVYIAQS